MNLLDFPFWLISSISLSLTFSLTLDKIKSHPKCFLLNILFHSEMSQYKIKQVILTSKYNFSSCIDLPHPVGHKVSNQLVIFTEANAERHQEALESSIRPILMQERLLQARTEASDLWAETQGQFSISDGLKAREKRGSERERAGLPVREVACDYVFIWPWCRPHIPDAFSNGWSSAHQNRLEDNERKCLSKTFVWKILTSPLCSTQTLFTFNLSFG